MAWYETGEDGPAGAPGAWQIFRIEGPAALDDAAIRRLFEAALRHNGLPAAG